MGIDRLAIALILIVALFCPAHGHDHNNPENNDWLQSLHSSNKTWCCNGKDTDIIDDWETKNGRYRVKFRGEWFDVPTTSVIDEPNRLGEPLLWMNKGYLGSSVRCFLPGALI